jgi:hypothetical protein
MQVRCVLVLQVQYILGCWLETLFFSSWLIFIAADGFRILIITQ